MALKSYLLRPPNLFAYTADAHGDINFSFGLTKLLSENVFFFDGLTFGIEVAPSSIG
jgi:hypothetical protein